MTPTEITAARETLGLTQTELSAVTGASRSAIARAEANGLARGFGPTLLRLLRNHPELVDEARALNQP